MGKHNWAIKQKKWERDLEQRLNEYRLHQVQSDSGTEGIVVSDYKSKESFVMVDADSIVDVVI